MKHNTLKRVLAGSLALLTVASPMTANVGGMLQDIAIVASAAQGDPVKFVWGEALQGYITNITIDGGQQVPATVFTGSDSYKFDNAQGNIATITSTIPLTASIEQNEYKWEAQARPHGDETEVPLNKDNIEEGFWQFKFTYFTYTSFKELKPDEQTTVNYAYNDFCAKNLSYSLTLNEFWDHAQEQDYWDGTKFTDYPEYEYFVEYCGQYSTFFEFVPYVPFEDLPEEEQIKYVNYLNVSDRTNDPKFQLKEGQFTVSKSADNVWTYQVFLKKDIPAGVSEVAQMSLAGDFATVDFKYDRNNIASAPEKLVDYHVSMKGVYYGNTLSTTSDIEETVRDKDGNWESGTVEPLVQNTKATLTSKNNFKVKLADSENSNYSEIVYAKYNASNKEYSATVTVPVTEGTCTMEIIALDASSLVYTADKNYLYVNGDSVDKDQVAASITASAYRAEVRTEKDALVSEEVDIEDFDYNGKLTYGTGSEDGVTVQITRDSELTTYDAVSLNNVLLTIRKDGNIWAGVNNLRFVGDKENGWHLIDASGSDAAEAEYTASAPSEHTYAKTDFVYDVNGNPVQAEDENGPIFDDEGNPVYETTGETVLTLNELYSLFEDENSSNNGFCFTEAGEYEISARFYTGVNTEANQGSNSAAINYAFKIDPIVVDPEDLTLELLAPDGNGGYAVVEDLTPVPEVFDENGAVVVEIPKKWQGKTFEVRIKPDEDNKQLQGFVQADPDNIPSDLAGGFKTFFVSGDTTVTKLNNPVNVTFDIYDQNYGATLEKGTNKPKQIPLTYTLVAAEDRPEITEVDDPEDIVYDYFSSSSSYGTTKKSAGILRIAKEDTTPDKFSEIFWRNYQGNEVVEANMDKITFAYKPVMGKSYKDDQLSLTSNGFPTKVNQDGYTLFALMDGKAFWSGNVMVVNNKVTLRLKDEAKNLTYGDTFDNKNFELVDSNGNVISDVEVDGIYVKSVYYADDGDKDKVSGTKNGVQTYFKPDGIHYATTREADIERGNAQNGVYDYVEVNGYDVYNAGTYVVNYYVDYDYHSDFVVASPEQIVTISKREISDPNFYVVDQEYNGKSQTHNRVQFRWAKKNEDGKTLYEITSDQADQPTKVGALLGSYRDIAVTITDGAKNAKDVGKYRLDLKANELVLNQDTYTDIETFFMGNYTGTATTYWCVTPVTVEGRQALNNGVDPGFGAVEFTWNTENTTVYDNGRIHVDYAMTNEANMKLPKGVTVADWGLVGCKSDQLPAPKRFVNGTTKKLTEELYTAQKKGGKDTLKALKDAMGGDENAAKDFLNGIKDQIKYRGLRDREETSYGNGFFEGHVSDKLRPTYTYGANISVQDVDTGEWVLPYVLFSDGTIIYDEYPIYLDLTMEATRVLQLELNPEYYLDRDKGQFTAGYDKSKNRYMAYAYYKEIDTAKVKAKVNDFGVVIAKAGQFDRAGVSITDPDRTVEDDLKINKKDALGLGVGHNNKAPGAVLKQEEYGAKIEPGFNDQGVWINAYLDLGNGLVVYTPCEYYESVSEFYSGLDVNDQRGALDNQHDWEGTFDLEDLNDTAIDADANDDIVHNPRVEDGKETKPGKVETTYDAANGEFTFEFNNTVPRNSRDYRFVKNGVIVSNDESLVQRDTFGPNHEYTIYRLRADADSKLVLNNGYIEGENGPDPENYDYKGNIDRNGNNVQVVRAYQQFKTKEGITVTVYGDITINYFGTDYDLMENDQIIVNGEVKILDEFTDDEKRAIERAYLEYLMSRGLDQFWA